MPHAYAYLYIGGDDLPLEEISRILGINPTESWKKGDPGVYVKERRDCGWCLHSPLPRSNSCLFEHFEALFKLLKPRVEAIRELGGRYYTSLICTGSYDGSVSPGLVLSKEDIAFLAAAGLNLDADLYFG